MVCRPVGANPVSGPMLAHFKLNTDYSESLIKSLVNKKHRNLEMLFAQ